MTDRVREVLAEEATALASAAQAYMDYISRGTTCGTVTIVDFHRDYPPLQTALTVAIGKTEAALQTPEASAPQPMAGGGSYIADIIVPGDGDLKRPSQPDTGTKDWRDVPVTAGILCDLFKEQNEHSVSVEFGQAFYPGIMVAMIERLALQRLSKGKNDDR